LLGRLVKDHAGGKPKFRMRTKPSGSTCSRKRCRKSSSDRVISFCWLLWANLNHNGRGVLKALDGLTYKEGRKVPDKRSGLVDVTDALGYLIMAVFPLIKQTGWRVTEAFTGRLVDDFTY
jgi:hypothetical protein